MAHVDRCRWDAISLRGFSGPVWLQSVGMSVSPECDRPVRSKGGKPYIPEVTMSTQPLPSMSPTAAEIKWVARVAMVWGMNTC